MESVLMGNEILTIDADTRTIEVPGDFLLGVETDNDAERVEFQCPKIVGDNLDLSQYHIYIHYQNAKGEKGKYLCDDIEDDGENITFSWLLSQKAVLYKGQTKFLVCAKKTQEETIVWNTTLASGNVLEGLDVDEEIVQQNDDVIEQILTRLDVLEQSGSGGSGITSRQINSLNELFKICSYTQNPSSQYNEFLIAFGLSEETVEIWGITNNLTNVVNSNSATSVTKNSSYSATLTAKEGYSISSVIVEMGGVDVTNTVYLDGVISISSVTGDVIITASAKQLSEALPTDKLLAYFDFRNASLESYNLSGWGNVYKLVDTNESNEYFAFGTTNIFESNEFGVANWGVREIRRKDNEATSVDLGQEFTIIGTSYGDCVPDIGGNIVKGNIGTSITAKPKYYNTNDDIATGNGTKANYTKSFNGYNVFAGVFTQDTLKIYANGALILTINPTEYKDYKKWKSKAIGYKVSYQDVGNYMTNYAIYKKALSEVEITDATAFLGKGV